MFSVCHTKGLEIDVVFNAKKSTLFVVGKMCYIVHGNGIPNGNGNPMGMGIKHRNENGNGREWETRAMGMGITCTPMGIYFL